jgi:arylsulfatase A-like enzyme
LGDHDLIGKGSFYEGSIHVPLLVHAPDMQAGSTCNDLVELLDVTATILHYSGPRGGYPLGAAGAAPLDSIPLPGVGSPQERRRDFVIGMVSNGWMIFDSAWKLAKYATGEQLLFNLETDPTEQHNLIDDPASAVHLRALDAVLTQEIMRSTTQSHSDKRVYTADLSGNPEFGKEGWRRPYPRSPGE